MSGSEHQFGQLGLSAPLVSAITSLGFSTPTPIQQQAIPVVLKGIDLLASAQTGTGKTAAYGLPILQFLIDNPSSSTTSVIDDLVTDDSATDEKAGETHLTSNRPNHSRKPHNYCRALILVPTRELAQQVFDDLNRYAINTEVKIVVVYGGTSIKQQQMQLSGGADIVVATPGRLLDHLFTQHLSLKQTEILVLDEADRMLDMGFMPDIERILRRLNQDRQTLFFSATFEKSVKDLAYNMLKSPIEIEVSPNNRPVDSVTQMIYPVDKKRKSELLAYLIGSRNWQQTLVFTKTKQASDALVKELKLDGIKAASINGDKSQGARQKALDDFKSGKIRALIATDIAARGIDVHQLEAVVNYDLPYKAEDYIHRIGRTGRADHQGVAVSFMSRDETYLLEAIENLLELRLPQEWLAGFEPSLVDDSNVEPSALRQSRSAEKRKLKAKLKIHQHRGKKRD